MTLFRLLTEGSRALKQAGDPDGIMTQGSFLWRPFIWIWFIFC